MKTHRRGAVLITAVMVMAVVSVVLALVTAQVIAQRNTLRMRERRLQAEWLARAGIELGAARLLEGPKEFSEENREIVPDGTVKIEVKKAADDIFDVSARAEVALPDETPVVRTCTAQFRRAGDGKLVRVEAN
jgi:type II secretory pathway component PulK